MMQTTPISRRALFHGTHPLTAALATLIGLATAPAGAAVTPFDYQQAGATLTYNIEITGQAHTGKARDSVWSKDAVSRHLQGTLHLTGRRTLMAHLDNAREKLARVMPARRALAADMPAIERIAAACGDDDACMNARMTKLVSGMSADKRAALVDATKGPAAKLSQHRRGDWALDRKTACVIEATSHGNSSYRSMAVGEGVSEYVSSSEQRQGHGSADCRHRPFPEASAHWDGDTKLLDLKLPGLTLVEQWTSGDGKHGSRKVDIPDIELEQLHWSGQGPQSGQQVRHISTVAGEHGLPATMTIRWTFTPNRS